MYLHDEAPSKASGPRRRIRSQGGRGYSEGTEIDRRIEDAASQEMELLMANGQLAADRQQTFEQNKMPLHIIPLQ
jgi:hypothetical protein